MKDKMNEQEKEEIKEEKSEEKKEVKSFTQEEVGKLISKQRQKIKEENEELKTSVADLKKQNEKLQMFEKKVNALKKNNLPLTFINNITGITEEELNESARTLTPFVSRGASISASTKKEDKLDKVFESLINSNKESF